MSVRGLDHVSVTCADLERSLAFYHGLLGIPVRDRGRLENGSLATILGVPLATAEFADLDLGDARTLELLCYEEPLGEPVDAAVHRPGAGHLSLRVDDVDAMCGRLAAAGHRASTATPVTLHEPGFWHGARVAYVSDPDGVTVELISWPERR